MGRVRFRNCVRCVFGGRFSGLIGLRWWVGCVILRRVVGRLFRFTLGGLRVRRKVRRIRGIVSLVLRSVICRRISGNRCVMNVASVVSSGSGRWSRM